ncbi:IS91 family transposase [Bradyrhizobium sp. 172]|nr:IS91 family transposase [Bradyrhizobium sp. 172]
MTPITCRNRHCPKCQGTARAAWLAARQAELLPVPYFHVVFTLPAPIAAIAFQNKAVVYAILFKAAAEAMTTLAANPRRLGGAIGGVAVLHTWGQALMHHPHVHCVVPGGGLSPDGARWIACRPNFFLAVKPLSRLFRTLISNVCRQPSTPVPCFFGDLGALAEPAAFAAHVDAMRRIVVYAKRPFGGPAQVLAYLGRYTHRVAIANSRLVALDEDQVAFSWKDYRQNSATKIMILKPDEFIRRILLHTLPDGFHRIRHFGFMANGHRAAKLALCRKLLDRKRTAPNDGEPSRVNSDALTSAKVPACPDCGGVMRIIARFRHSFSRSNPRTPPFRHSHTIRAISQPPGDAPPRDPSFSSPQLANIIPFASGLPFTRGPWTYRQSSPSSSAEIPPSPSHPRSPPRQRLAGLFAHRWEVRPASAASNQAPTTNQTHTAAARAPSGDRMTIGRQLNS